MQVGEKADSESCAFTSEIVSHNSSTGSHVLSRGVDGEVSSQSASLECGMCVSGSGVVSHTIVAPVSSQTT